jgi:hypothetical protein
LHHLKAFAFQYSLHLLGDFKNFNTELAATVSGGEITTQQKA